MTGLDRPGRGKTPQWWDPSSPALDGGRVVYRAFGAMREDPLVMVEVDGEVTGPLPHVVKHSPSGFAWGYAGSGPAELARCLLIHALDAEPDCPECKGTGCFWCDGGYRAPTPRQYQGFKFDRIASLPQGHGWQLTRDEIRNWVAANLDIEAAVEGAGEAAKNRGDDSWIDDEE